MKKKKDDRIKEEVLVKKIIPKRDFHIFFPPLYDIKIKADEEIEIPIMFVQNLKTENII